MNPIRHIEMWVSNMERSMAFYKSFLEMLGWQQVDANGFSCDGTKVYFREVKAPIMETLGPRHICFGAAGKEVVDNITKQLESQGAKILHGPAVLHAGGSYLLVFKDPDGYILEVAHKE